MGNGLCWELCEGSGNLPRSPGVSQGRSPGVGKSNPFSFTQVSCAGMKLDLAHVAQRAALTRAQASALGSQNEIDKWADGLSTAVRRQSSLVKVRDAGHQVTTTLMLARIPLETLHQGL